MGGQLYCRDERPVWVEYRTWNPARRKPCQVKGDWRRAYKSYGILKQRSETDLRLLVDQMLAEGYIVQTGEYSVLQMGDISRLKRKARA